MRFWFDDGTEDFAQAGSKNSAEFYALEQFGENLVFGVHPFLLNTEKAAKLRPNRLVATLSGTAG